MTASDIKPDFIASGTDDFADELAEHIKITETVEVEGDGAIPYATKSYTNLSIEEQEIYVGVGEFWCVGGGLPTIDVGKKDEVPWEAVLLRLYDGNKMAVYRVSQL